MNRTFRFLFFGILITSCKEDPNNGTHKIYYDGSNILMETVEYKDGKKNGYFTDYYRNRGILSRQYYVNDIITDSSITYRENGVMASLYFYRMGKKTGVWKNFNKNGMVYREVTFENNRLNGPANKYTYITGRPLERLNYVDGVPEGKQEYFYNNGRPKASYFIRLNHMTELEEWEESGKKIDNDFQVSIKEENHLKRYNTISLIVTVDKNVDEVFEGIEFEPGVMVPVTRFEGEGNNYVGKYTIRKGYVLNRKINIVIKSKSKLGHTMEKIVPYNFSVKN